jgi:uncharacterized tellurite resistance protein B-like protein
MIKRIFEQVAVAISAKPVPAEDDSTRQKGIRLATAVLMLDVARADHVFDETEFDEVLELVETHFGLSPEDSAELVNEADYKAENLTSLHEFTQLLHQNLDEDEKSSIVEMLWKIAYADGRLDKYEDSLVLKISDLLHVSRGKVMKLKHDTEVHAS